MFAHYGPVDIYADIPAVKTDVFNIYTVFLISFMLF